MVLGGLREIRALVLRVKPRAQNLDVECGQGIQSGLDAAALKGQHARKLVQEGEQFEERTETERRKRSLGRE